MNLLLPKTRQDSDCLTSPAILGPLVWGNKLLERKGNVAIYEGPHPGAFEVIIIRIAEESLFNGHVVPRREVYPSAEAWGTYGWTYSSNSHPDPLKAAWAKMQQLTRARTEPTTDAAHRTKKKVRKRRSVGRTKNKICR